MKRNFVIGLFGSLVGFGVLFILLSAADIVGARSADVPPRQARPGSASAATPLTSTFTYQGQLKNSGNAVNGSCDMAFRMYDALSAGNLIGSPITATVSINNGFFTAGLNFGNSAVTGIARWLDIRVRCPAGSGSYTTLSPRQALTPAPAALTLGAPGSVSGYLVAGASGPYYPTIGFNNSGPSDGSAYLAGVAGYGGLFQFQVGTGKLTYYTGSSVPAGAPRVNTPQFTIASGGNVGIGTTNPSAALSVVRSGAVEPVVQNVPTGLKVGTPSGTIPLALRQNVAESGQPALLYLETSSGDLGYLGANSSAFIVGGSTSHGLGFNVDGSIRAMTILSDGEVGIGTDPWYFPYTDLAVRSKTSNTGAIIMAVTNSIAHGGFWVADDGTVHVALNQTPSAEHICGLGAVIADLSVCASAAEYVPSIDSRFGFPETADLVSLLPSEKNPYADEHSPFVVGKTTKPCDENLLGFVTDPKHGADGEKKNDHYLPLAIYGYFPAKVTMENGAIHRGDPLTSSSKPGYAMKTTQACKIIGYALEDADHEGTIQVFAHLSENAAPEVASLRAQVQELKAQNVAFEARLAALEKPVRADSIAAADAMNPPNLGSVAALIGFGWLWLQQRKRRGGAQ